MMILLPPVLLLFIGLFLFFHLFSDRVAVCVRDAEKAPSEPEPCGVGYQVERKTHTHTERETRSIIQHKEPIQKRMRTLCCRC